MEVLNQQFILIRGGSRNIVVNNSRYVHGVIGAFLAQADNYPSIAVHKLAGRCSLPARKACYRNNGINDRGLNNPVKTLVRYCKLANYARPKPCEYCVPIEY
jgi:hypothetical protein